LPYDLDPIFPTVRSDVPVKYIRHVSLNNLSLKTFRDQIQDSTHTRIEAIVSVIESHDDIAVASSIFPLQ
jgi:hypothetical protein